MLAYFNREISAVYRMVIFYLLRPLLVRGTYDNPELVMGYTGWYRLRGTDAAWGCIAFTHDKGLQFRW